MILAIIIVILCLSGLFGKLFGNAGFFALTSDLSPWVTVISFILILYLLYRVVTRRK